MQINHQHIFFPHEHIRDIQKTLVAQISSVISNKQNLVVHAPTGCGKTASSLSAALTFAIQNNKTVIFVTPMHSQHKIAVDTLRLIKQKYNLDFKATDFIGKKWMCLQNNAQEMSSSEFSEFCYQFVKNDLCDFYLNFKDNAKKQLVLNEIKDIKHVEEIIESSNKYKLCPFEIASENAKISKVIVADYFHVLSPSIREAFFKRIHKDIENCIIIFDEAHNLVDKCRDLLSNSLSTFTIENAIKESKRHNLELHEELNLVRNKLLSLISDLSLYEDEKLIKKNDFFFEDNLIIRLKVESEKVLEEDPEKKKSSIKTISNFLSFWKGEDYGFVRAIKRAFFKGKPYYSIIYKCLDPSLIFSKLNSYSTILMSGTLTPHQMYLDLLGMNKTKTVTAEYKNPFPITNRLALIIPKTSTKYSTRSDESYKKIAETCAEIVNSIPGNTLIFFPSYDLRDKVNNFFATKCEKTTLLEYPKLKKQEKQELLEKFKQNKNHGSVLLAASSGSFGQGIDLIGCIKCVIVVGLPLAKPDLETKELINYYDKRFSKGWDYGYIYPAIIKSIQNAGRCIRSETDKGVIIFLDERYSLQTYKKCFPPDYNFEVTLDYLPKIKEFFK